MNNIWKIFRIKGKLKVNKMIRTTLQMIQLKQRIIQQTQLQKTFSGQQKKQSNTLKKVNQCKR